MQIGSSLSLSLSVQWGVWGHAELSAPWTASQCAVSLRLSCFGRVQTKPSERLMPFLVTALRYRRGVLQRSPSL